MSEVMKDQAKNFPFLKILLRKVGLIVLALVLGIVVGFCYSKYVAKPVYTASSAVILRMSSDVMADSGKETTEITLAKYYLPTVADIAVSPVVIKSACDAYGEANSIKVSSITITYGEESLIFSISYQDKSAKAASDKLDVYIQSIAEHLDNEKQNLIKAEGVSLIPTQNKNTVEVDSGLVKFSLIGGVLAVGIAVLLIFASYKIDNTFKSKSDFEELTGIDVLSMLSNK